MSRPELSVVVPFYNEQDNAKTVLSGLGNALDDINYEIIAVNNGSTDNTASVLREVKNSRIIIVTVEKNIGFGYGIRKGLESAKGKYLGYMWGDNQISAGVVAEIYRKLAKEGLDLCKIRRAARDYGFFRKLESAAYNRIFLALFFGKISNDINGSPKIMKRALYERLGLESNDWFIDTELMVKVKVLGGRVGEVKAAYNKRSKGKSKVKFYVMMEFLSNILRFRFGGLKKFKDSVD